MLSLKLVALLKWVQVLHFNTGASFLELVLVGYLVSWLIMRNYADKIVIPVQKSDGNDPWKRIGDPVHDSQNNTFMGHISTLSVKNTKKNNHVLTVWNPEAVLTLYMLYGIICCWLVWTKGQMLAQMNTWSNPCHTALAFECQSSSLLFFLTNPC